MLCAVALVAGFVLGCLYVIADLAATGGGH